MSFRSIVVTSQSKLTYKNRYLVVKKDMQEQYVHLSEIDTIIVDSISVSISAYLLKEVSEHKINIIFCDEKHNPFGELKSYYSRYNSSKTILNQIKWKNKEKDLLWSLIVKNKILNQSLVLKKLEASQYNLVDSYIDEVKIGDKTNREGHAAKVYFNALFGKNFVRNNTDSINAALNYGYAVLLSTINKEIINNGFITQLGIHHKNEFNDFNLTCDLMEPLRPIIDLFVYYNMKRDFDKQYKLDMVNLFNHTFKFQNKMYTLKDVIKLYVKSTLDFMEKGKEYENFIYEG